MDPAFEGSVLLATEAVGLRGTTILTVNVAREMARREIPVTLVTTAQGFFREALGDSVELMVHPWIRSPVLRRFARSAIITAALPRKPAVLHLQGIGDLAFWGRIARRLGCAFLATATNFVHGRIWSHRSAFRQARFLAVSEAVRANLVNDGKVPKELVRLTRSGVDCSMGVAAGEREDKRLNVITTMGSLEERKGLETFLAAVHKLAQRRMEFQVLIIGSGPLERRLKKLRDRLGIVDKVIFAPDSAAYGQLLSETDIFVLPSEAQPLGQTMLEAMARGKPVVASGVGGIYSVLEDRRHGLIVASEDVDALAEAIAKLLENDELRRSMGAEARKRVCEEFRIEDKVSELLDLYAECIGKQG